MGDRENPPSLPDLEGNMVADSNCYAEARNCNWMQALEGDIDTVHFSWLHAGHLQPEDAEGDFIRYQSPTATRSSPSSTRIGAPATPPSFPPRKRRTIAA
jgi:hypothetical protein